MSRRFFLVVRGDLNFSCTTRNKIKSSNKMLSERWWLICRWRIFVVLNLTLKLVSILSSCGFTRHHSMFIHNVKLWPKIINRERKRDTHESDLHYYKLAAMSISAWYIYWTHISRLFFIIFCATLQQVSTLAHQCVTAYCCTGSIIPSQRLCKKCHEFDFRLVGRCEIINWSELFHWQFH